MTANSPLMIGNETDTHFRTIAEKLREHGLEPIIFDADSFPHVKLALSQDELTVEGKTIPKESRAWLRRAVPSRWSTGDLVGSVSDVSLRTRVALIASIARSCGYKWITGIDALLAAEDRMHQLVVAQSIGIAIPRTIVASDPLEILRALGEDVVLKPLASGAFVKSDGQPHAVYTTPLTADLITSGDFGTAPFVAQQRIHTHQHVRVVTAGHLAKTTILDADPWPVDWRVQMKLAFHGKLTSHPR